MTPLELRHATVGYSEATIRAAVEAGLREVPFTDLPNELTFAPLAGHWLTDPDNWEWIPPPLTEAQVAAIHRHLAPAPTDELH